MPQNSKRRPLNRPPKEDSESEMSGEDRSEDNDPSVSPEIVSQPLSRRSSNVVDKRPILDGFSAIAGPSEPREGLHSMPPRPKSGITTGSSGVSDGRTLFKDNELPHIATLSLPENSPAAAMSAPPLPPIRPASEQQAAQRKRASTVPGRSNRPAASTGPKVVACNFCRGWFVEYRVIMD